MGPCCGILFGIFCRIPFEVLWGLVWNGHLHCGGAPTHTSAYWWGQFSRASVGCRHWAGLTEPLHSFSWDLALVPVSPENTVGIWIPGQQYQPKKPPGLPPTACDLNADGHGLDSAELHALGVIQSTVLHPRHIRASSDVRAHVDVQSSHCVSCLCHRKCLSWTSLSMWPQWTRSTC